MAMPVAPAAGSVKRRNEFPDVCSIRQRQRQRVPCVTAVAHVPRDTCAGKGHARYLLGIPARRVTKQGRHVTRRCLTWRSWSSAWWQGARR